MPTPDQIARYQSAEADDFRQALVVELALQIHGASLEAHRRAVKAKPDESHPAPSAWDASLEAARSLLEAAPAPAAPQPQTN